MMKKNIRQVCLLITASSLLLIASCSPNSNESIVADPSLAPVPENKDRASDPTLDYLAKRTDNSSTSQVNVNVSKNDNVQVLTLESSYTVSEPRDLFNGKDLSGWVNETGGEPIGWIVEDGLLRLVDPTNGGDILTSELFTNYILTFEWRFGLECNSGVKYKLEQPNGKGWIGLEYQIQDDAHMEDGKVNNRKIASLFDVFPAKESSQASNYPPPSTHEPNGDFRQGKIVVFGNNVEHWIDGEKVLEFTIGSNEWNGAKSQSKFKNQKNFGLIATSPILLQAHGCPIDFRSIRIQTLTSKN